MTKLTILVSGMIARVPYQGGATWAILQFVLGFRELGHDVYFVEQIKPGEIQPSGAPLDQSVNAAYFRQMMSEFGLEGNSVLMLEGTEETVGLEYAQLCRAAGAAEVLVNYSGLLADETLTASVPVRVYLDGDPGFTQLWQTVEHIDLRFAGHTHFATVGVGLGQPGCDVPDCGLEWIPLLPPVVLSRWPAAGGIPCDALTTVANWRGYGSIRHNGVLYGQKAHSLRQFIRLPQITSESFVLALAIHPDEDPDLERLRQNGWELLDPAVVASTPGRYQTFVQGSKAEFGIAKTGYVLARCGWFSDRSVCYLASARPVIAQETGFSRFLPTGEGLFAFEREDDVLCAIEELRRDYSKHTNAARAIAEEYFDSKKVLGGLLQRVGLG